MDPFKALSCLRTHNISRQARRWPNPLRSKRHLIAWIWWGLMRQFENNNSDSLKSLNSRCRLCSSSSPNKLRAILKSKLSVPVESKLDSNSNFSRSKGCYLGRLNEWHSLNTNRFLTRWNSQLLVCQLCLSVIANKSQCHHRSSNLNKNVDHPLKHWSMIT